jgi:SAM-dependent methyltransferase
MSGNRLLAHKPEQNVRVASPAGRLASTWGGSAWQIESTLHQLSPYIGKTKSSMAASLLAQYTKPGDVVYDPFSGSGTFAYEAWLAGRHVVASDLSPYATLLTGAKLFPYGSLDEALRDLEEMRKRVALQRTHPDLRHVPRWVREFFHTETLREVLVWTQTLKEKERWFLLACLMGILHHQRPGFLSLPSSHTIPYLRVKKFPRARFPDLYLYRSLTDRLEAKVRRAFRRVPELDAALVRACYGKSADRLVPPLPVDAIVTSPPYMRQLDYGRDNRLRLWFLGCIDWRSLDKSVSPGEQEFLALMRRCFRRWRTVLKPNGNCVLVVGDACSRENNRDLPERVAGIALEEGGYRLVSQRTDPIPNERRVRRGIIGSASETILVLRSSPKNRTHTDVRKDHAATL